MHKSINRRWRVTVIIIVAVLGGGILDRLWLAQSSKQEISSSSPQPLYWVAPMDPSFKRDKPGKSPMGMDLVPVYAEEDSIAAKEEAGVVTIEPHVENNLGLRLGRAEIQNLDLQIRTVGYIAFDENKLTHFHSRVEGWIERLNITAVGDPVKKGQELYELYSPELVYAQQEFLSSINSGVMALQESAQGKLKSWNISDSQIASLRSTGKIHQRLKFNSDENGYIASLNVREGMFITPSTTILSIGNLDSVWVIAEIFERQAGWIKPGQSVSMQVDSFPGEKWQGVVDYIYPILNQQTRTLRARVIFDNPGHRLKPNMFAKLTIQVDPAKQILAVPREAVIRNGNSSRIVKALGNGRYQSITVNTGTETDEYVEILAGLHAGDQIVTSAQFLIDSESSVTAELNRITYQNNEPRMEDHSGHPHD